MLGCCGSPFSDNDFLWASFRERFPLLFGQVARLLSGSTLTSVPPQVFGVLVYENQIVLVLFHRCSFRQSASGFQMVLWPVQRPVKQHIFWDHLPDHEACVITFLSGACSFEFLELVLFFHAFRCSFPSTL